MTTHDIVFRLLSYSKVAFVLHNHGDHFATEVTQLLAGIDLYSAPDPWKSKRVYS